MNNLKRLITSLVLAAFLGGISGMVWAKDLGDNNLSDYTCKDLMLFESGHRDVAIAILHGYFMGKKGSTVFNSDEFAGRTDKFLDYCLDHPTANAVDSMARVSK